MGGNTYLLWLHRRCIEGQTLTGGFADLREFFCRKRSRSQWKRQFNEHFANPGMDQVTGILILIITINTFILH